MADKICGDGIGNSTGRLYNADVDLITPSTMYGSSPGEPRTLVQSVDTAGPKKKPTSFQITSVTVQGSRLSNDGGDESADDLDESHTEDLSSDILDCSKTTDTEQLSPTEDTTAAVPPAPASEADPPVTVSAAAPSDPVSGLSTAVSVSPAVVTGAAGTLAIVAGAPAAPSTTEGPINPDHWQRRFKVVKIVSSEPFGRGRWLCMDFVDPPAMQADAKAGEERDSNTAAADLPPAVSNEAVAHVYEIPVGQTYPANSQQSGPLYGIILPVSGQGASPLSVLQPIGEQQQQQPTAVAEPAAAVPPKPAAVVTPAVPEQQQAVAADVAAATQTVEPIPENATKSATEEDSERFPGRVARVPSRLPFGKGGHKAKVHDLLLTSAGSTVAIDNKIEQAMDLVKSHLMFAVREEVDVLKEKITELLDRIAQLEYENNILRAGASPETLSLLAQSTQQDGSASVTAAADDSGRWPSRSWCRPSPQLWCQPTTSSSRKQAPVASVQPVAMQPAPVQPVQAPQLVTVVQQPQQLVHQQPQQLVHQQPQQLVHQQPQQLVHQQPHQQPQPLPSQPVQLQHQPHLPQHQQQHLQQKQPLQQPPPT
ncbi:LOW QUALITY PROTEIN: protein bunched, class 2/F/G isoform-like [Rhipicephalus sanguineus]|uniref:LOW QUALITY PROTEIN: protein bunched, class 2/F/G isoform-like n=1 Tax=Rhipicephalus sanguineus TaxID=34632 RepID=UPI0018950C27|nr:LOW QUALITY PROTEIN: protein bunched, class 2/F/G isoform-like [Rhipicephalus sanguineus]